jgi:hypothetical protein
MDKNIQTEINACRQIDIQIYRQTEKQTGQDWMNEPDVKNLREESKMKSWCGYIEEEFLKRVEEALFLNTRRGRSLDKFSCRPRLQISSTQAKMWLKQRIRISQRFYLPARGRCYKQSQFSTTFSQFSAKKLAFLLKTNVMINFLPKLCSWILSKKRQIFRRKYF